MRQNKYEYDAFISHAVEDKIPIANELCAKLERAGLKIWYSGKELGIGDSIEKTIQRGLNRSRYGIVIFSPTYLAKNWTIREFYTLLAKEIEEQKVILPVLYNITLDELKNKDLVMADRFAVNSDKGIDFVVERLVGEIKRANVVKKKKAWLSRIWLVLILSLLANATLLLKGTVSAPDYSALPSLDEQSQKAEGYGNGHPTLFGEMQGLLAKFNGCSCNHQQNCVDSRPIQSPGESHVARLLSTEPSRAQGGKSKGRTAPRQTNKITMAVVFQIEAADQASPPFQPEGDDLLQTLSMNDEEAPFISVTNRDISLEHDQHDCTHGGHPGN